MKLLSITITGIVFAACIVSSHAAEVTLPEIYADHMVIQTDEPIIVSGTVSPTSAELEIKLAGQTVSVTPRLFGGWTATLDPVSEVGGSHTLTIWAEGVVAHGRLGALVFRVVAAVGKVGPLADQLRQG